MNQVLKQTWLTYLLAALISVLGFAFIWTIFMVGSKKHVVVVLAAFGFFVAAIGSGNLRLLSLWMLFITYPMNLSTNLTELMARGGGAASVRIEANEVFLGILFLYLLSDLWKNRDDPAFRFRVPKISYVWLLIMGFGVYAVFFERWARVAAYETIRMGKVLVFFIILTNELRTKSRMMHAIAGISLGLLLEGLVGVTQYVKGGNLGLEFLGETAAETIKHLSDTSLKGEAIWRVSALLLHPNIFGIYVAMLLPLAFTGVVAPGGKPIYKYFFLAACLLGGMGMLASFSRSSWVSAFTAMSLFVTLVCFHKRMQKRMLFFAVIGCIVGGVLFAGVSGKIMKRLFESKEVATHGRAEFKKEAKRIINDRPLFGHGLNSYVDVLRDYTKYSSQAHQGWLPPVHHIYYLWWSETGLVGLILHLLLIGQALWVGLRNMWVRDPILFTINAACIAGICAMMVDGFFSFSFRLHSIMKTFFILTSLMLAIRYWHLRHERSGQAVITSSIPTDETIETPAEPEKREPPADGVDLPEWDGGMPEGGGA